MADSRRTIVQLERFEESLKGCISREKRQFERLHFCLKKARSDTAYIKTLESLKEDK